MGDSGWLGLQWVAQGQVVLQLSWGRCIGNNDMIGRLQEWRWVTGMEGMAHLIQEIDVEKTWHLTSQMVCW